MSDQFEDKSAVFQVDSPIGVINLVIDGVNKGSAWIDGLVKVNNIPHKVGPVEWTVGWNDKVYANGGYWGIRRVDTSEYGEQTTANARRKITDAITEAARSIVARPDSEHLGRLAELRAALGAHESQVKRFQDQIEDLQKKIKLEADAADTVRAMLDRLENGHPEAFNATYERYYKKGEKQATEDLGRVGGDDADWSSVYEIQNEAEKKLRAIEKSAPVPHITRCADVAYFKGYLTVCKAVEEIVRTRMYANR